MLPNVPKSHEEIQIERNQQLAARFVASWEQAVTLSKVWWWAQNWAQSPSVILVSRSCWLGPETDPCSTLLPDCRQSGTWLVSGHKGVYRYLSDRGTVTSGFVLARHPLSSELNQSGICWLEAAFLEIELTQVIFKVYVEPLAPSLASFSDRYRKHFGSYAVALSLRRYNRVQN